MSVKFLMLSLAPALSILHGKDGLAHPLPLPLNPSLSALLPRRAFSSNAVSVFSPFASLLHVCP